MLVSGLKVNHTSYSRAVAQSNSVEINDNCPVAETNSCEEQVLSFLRSKSVEISKNDISICHTVKTKSNKPQIVITLNNRKAKKNRVLSQDKDLTGTNVFINEHLTHTNAELARLARHYKRTMTNAINMDQKLQIFY